MPIFKDVKRGCGWRKLGGIYLIGAPLAAPCHLLPFPIGVCPCCGNGFKFFRGITWVNAELLFKDKCQENIRATENFKVAADERCDCCPICSPEGEYGFMWVGEKYYTPESFAREAFKYGVSKRIPFVPKKLREVETEWDYPEILLAHRKACNGSPGIFMSFKPIGIQKLVPDDTPEAELEKLKKDGIEPILVNKNDPKHNPQPTSQEVLV
jgi:hypothetical protein